MKARSRTQVIALAVILALALFSFSIVFSAAQAGVVNGQTRAGLAVQAPGAEVALVVDDGDEDVFIGVNYSTTGGQFVWLNRFTPDPVSFPFSLEQVWVRFDDKGGENNIHVGDAIELLVYTDANPNPTDGAILVASFDTTIPTVDGSLWAQFTLNPAITITGTGDVLIGVVNRYTVDHVSPKTFPAALDTSTNQGRSWDGWYTNGSVPADPALPPDDSFEQVTGNWLIRGYGHTITLEVTPTPTLTATPTPGRISLPFILKAYPTPSLANVYIQNDTNSQLCYEVFGTGLGQKCFGGGKSFYGSFPPGTYNFKATARCGAIESSREFTLGDWTHNFWCEQNIELLNSW